MKKLAGLLLLACLTAGPAFAVPYFVDGAASGLGTGAIGDPFKKIQGALNVAAAGDSIYIRAGTYTVSASDTTAGTFALQSNGAADSGSIVLRSYPGETVTIKPSGTAAVLTVNKDRWTFLNLIFDQNAKAQDCIKVGSQNTVSDHIAFDTCELKNGLRDGIDVAAARQFTVTGCNIHDFLYPSQGDAHGIVFGTTTLTTDSLIQDVTITGTRFTRLSGDGIQFFGETNDDTTNYVRGATISSCTFTSGFPTKNGDDENAIDCKAVVDLTVSGCVISGYLNNPGQSIVVQKGCKRVTIANNVISNCWAGIDFHREGTGDKFIQSGHRVYGNLIFNIVGDPPSATQSTMYGMKFDGVDGAKVYNNTMTSTGTSGNPVKAIRVDETVSGQGFINSVFENNLMYNFKVASSEGSGMSGTVVGYNGWFGPTGRSGLLVGSGDQTGTGSPGFINAAAGDYRPSYSPTSKLIDKGTDSLVVWTFNGTKPDIGYSESGEVAAYFVSPHGNDSNLGTTMALAWQTISKANATLPAPSTANGDIVVYVAPGVYSTMPNPAAAPTDGKRFRFYGSPGDPTETAISVLPSPYERFPTLTKDYVTLIGFDLLGKPVIAASATFDSMVSCRSDQGLALHGDYCVVTGHNAAGGNLSIGRGAGLTLSGTGGAGDQSPTKAVCDSVIASTFGAASDTTVGIGYYASGSVPEWVDSLLFRDNVVLSTPKSSHAKPVACEYTTRSNFIGNRYTIISSRTGPGDVVNFFSHSDSSASNRWARDTLLSSGGVEVSLWSSSLLPGSSRTVDSCYYQASGGIGIDDRMLNDAISRTVVVSDGPALAFRGSIVTGNSIDHCTLVGRPAVTTAGIVDFRDATWDGDGGGDDLTFTNNIVYGGNDAPVADCEVPGNAIYWGSQLLAPDKAIGVPHAVNSDHNLLSWYGQVEALGDREVGWGLTCSGVGATAWQDSCEAYYPPAVADSNSVYGSPRFYPDSLHAPSNPSNLLTEEYRLGARSKALGAGTAGSDIGASGTPGSPAPAIVAVSQAKLVGGCNVSGSVTVSVYNAGSAVLEITGAGFTGDERTVGYFSVSPSTASISPDGTQVFTVSFEPGSQEQMVQATLVLTTNDPNHPHMDTVIYCSE